MATITLDEARRRQAELAQMIQDAEAQEREAARVAAAANAPALGRNPLEDFGELPDMGEVLDVLAELAHGQAQTSHLRNDPCGGLWEKLQHAIKGKPANITPARVASTPAVQVNPAQEAIDFHRTQLEGAVRRSDAGAIEWSRNELSKLGVQV